MTAGAHGSTFGGNPLAAAVGGAVLDIVLDPGFLAHVSQMGRQLRQQLMGLKAQFPTIIAEVRGEGLMFGLKTSVANSDFALAAREEKLLSVLAGDNVVRLLPPLIIDESHILDASMRLRNACARLSRTAKELGAA
jgi:acetylornithine/N-succinyldiaminopimelate aminotransferase